MSASSPVPASGCGAWLHKHGGALKLSAGSPGYQSGFDFDPEVPMMKSCWGKEHGGGEGVGGRRCQSHRVLGRLPLSLSHLFSSDATFLAQHQESEMRGLIKHDRTREAKLRWKKGGEGETLYTQHQLIPMYQRSRPTCLLEHDFFWSDRGRSRFSRQTNQPAPPWQLATAFVPSKSQAIPGSLETNHCSWGGAYDKPRNLCSGQTRGVHAPTTQPPTVLDLSSPVCNSSQKRFAKKNTVDHLPAKSLGEEGEAPATAVWGV